MQLTAGSSRCSLPLLRLILLSAWLHSHTPWPLLASWVYSMSVSFTFAIFWKLKSYRRWPFLFSFLVPISHYDPGRLSSSLNKMKDHIDIRKPSIRGFKTPRFFLLHRKFSNKIVQKSLGDPFYLQRKAWTILFLKLIAEVKIGPGSLWRETHANHWRSRPILIWTHSLSTPCRRMGEKSHSSICS